MLLATNHQSAGGELLLCSSNCLPPGDSPQESVINHTHNQNHSSKKRRISCSTRKMCHYHLQHNKKNSVIRSSSSSSIAKMASSNNFNYFYLFTLFLALASSALFPFMMVKCTSVEELSLSSSELIVSSSSSIEDEDNLFSRAFDYHTSMPVITKRELANAIKQATASVRALRDSLEVSMFKRQQVMEVGSAGWWASSMFNGIGATSSSLEEQLLTNHTNQALISEEATRILSKEYKLNRLQILRGLPLISVDLTSLGKLCPRSSRTFNCMPGRYRSLTGHCNNVQNPDWGAAQSALVRYAPPSYIDNVSRPPPSSRGSGRPLDRNILPSSRAVSLALHNRKNDASFGADEEASRHSTHMTTMISFFGQFVFHDLAQVSQYGAHEKMLIKCCASEQQTGTFQASLHPECMPVEQKSQLSSTSSSFCLDYVRSAPAIRTGCSLGPRDQMNLVSSYLDGSTIYGSSEEQMRSLRTFSGGRLRSQRFAQASPLGGQSSIASGNSPPASLELLPLARLNSTDREADHCRQVALMRKNEQSASCFVAGDSRVNENIGLTLMHTIWMREHNSIADKLAQLNRHWRDERIFEEARRIVIAELQHITYSEFLPSIFSEEVMLKFNLTTQSQGYFQGYDPQLNGAISNELASGVFPFILSTLPNSLERYSDRLEMLGRTSLAETFMDSSDLFKRNRFAQYLMGMISQNAMEPMHGLMPALTVSAEHKQRLVAMTTSGNFSRLPGESVNSLFGAASGEPAQIDLLALTIQRGRDHGLKAYLYWRQVCQLKPLVRSWQDLGQVMPVELVERLRSVYNSPDQLDLYLALLETPLPGAAVGPTLVCLLARQFHHLKHADRYWYENDLPGSAFTPGQLEEIRQTSLAKVICRNSQSSLSFIQPAPMLASDPFLNAYQYCTNKAMNQLDLSRWRKPVQSAQQIADELLMGELAQSALARTSHLLDSNRALVSRSIRRARRQLDELAREEALRLRRAKRSPPTSSSHHSSAGYRYLPRLKRQTLQLNNQSLIFEMATNEVVRALLRQGRDREHGQSLQSDIREFLNSLELIQLENLIDNSGSSSGLEKLISSTGSNFLTKEQRSRLIQARDPLFVDDDPLTSPSTGGVIASATSSSATSSSSSVSTNCQDDDKAFPCDHTSPFRTITGWCNNLDNPKFAQSFTNHDRILANAYEDGLAKARQLSVVIANRETGERLPLPSARLISTSMHDDVSQLHLRYSLALMQFGQFGVDHDLTRTPFSVALDGSLLDCSACDSRKTVHRDCLPIPIPDGDPHFNSPKARQQLGNARKCLHFVRSLNGQPGLGPRQQMNALTSYLDASEIYGSDNCEAKSLRAFHAGRLNSSSYPAPQTNFPGFTGSPREILPVTFANPECVTPGGLCFHAGDQRASEQPGLTAIHTIFLRLHNSVVGQLAQVNRHWNDEKLYQHGRRIVGAIMQRITYNEFAPRLLGFDYMSKFDLLLKNVGYSSPNHYDDTCSASIFTEFSAAAFRMGHSLIRNAFPLLNKQYKPIGKSFQLRKAFFNSQRILTEPNLIDSILRGIVSTPIETLDNSITEELTNHLFEKPKEPFSGMDLISLNIQRARDHGIPSYNKYRIKCNLTRAKSFDDLGAEIPGNLIKRLENLYASVDDIDLFTGGMSELPVHGGIIGPTLGCIIGMQFSRLKRCDRFWHETNDPWIRFSLPQLAEIRKMSLAKVICQESDNIDAIQRQAMDVPDQYLNPRVACSNLPSMDFSLWSENVKSCQVNKIKLELGQSKRINPCKSCTCTLEGPVCRTAKINCLQVMKRVDLSSIMADKSCLVQCAWALDMQSLSATS